MDIYDAEMWVGIYIVTYLGRDASPLMYKWMS